MNFSHVVWDKHACVCIFFFPGINSEFVSYTDRNNGKIVGIFTENEGKLLYSCCSLHLFCVEYTLVLRFGNGTLTMISKYNTGRVFDGSSSQWSNDEENPSDLLEPDPGRRGSCCTSGPLQRLSLVPVPLACCRVQARRLCVGVSCRRQRCLLLLVDNALLHQSLGATLIFFSRALVDVVFCPCLE